MNDLLTKLLLIKGFALSLRFYSFFSNTRGGFYSTFFSSFENQNMFNHNIM